MFPQRLELLEFQRQILAHFVRLEPSFATAEWHAGCLLLPCNTSELSTKFLDYIGWKVSVNAPCFSELTQVKVTIDINSDNRGLYEISTLERSHSDGTTFITYLTADDVDEWLSSGVIIN